MKLKRESIPIRTARLSRRSITISWWFMHTNYPWKWLQCLTLTGFDGALYNHQSPWAMRNHIIKVCCNHLLHQCWAECYHMNNSTSYSILRSLENYRDQSRNEVGMPVTMESLCLDTHDCRRTLFFVFFFSQQNK